MARVPFSSLMKHEALKGFSRNNYPYFYRSCIGTRAFQDYDYVYALAISDFKMRGMDGMKLLNN